MTANGQLRPDQLAVYRTVKLAPQAAHDAQRMEDAARAEAGISIRPVSSHNGAAGYRSADVQEDMHAHPGLYGLRPSPPAPPLAPVGMSRHGQGRALDIAGAEIGSKLRAWILKNGPRFGWLAWSSDDPNHFEHGTNVVTQTEPALAGGGTTPIPPPISEEDDMPDNSGFTYTRASDNKPMCLIVNTGSGFCSEYNNPGGNYNNPIAGAFHTGNFAPITESHANAIKTDLAKVRTKAQ